MIKVKCDPAGLPGIAYDCWHEMRDIHLRTSDKLSLAIRPPAMHKMLVEEVSLKEWLDETEDEDSPNNEQQLEEFVELQCTLPAEANVEDDGIPVLYPEDSVHSHVQEDNRPAIEFIQVVLT